MSQCKYQKCSEEAWQGCPKGFCIYHSPDNGKDDAIARQVWDEARKRAKNPERRDFRGWRFPKDPDRKCFENITFVSSAAFTCFNDARFERDAVFVGSKFEGRVSFVASKFAGDVFFNQVNFAEQTVFNRANFEEDTFFHGAKFGGDTLFNGAKFKAGAFFYWAKFERLAKFGSVFHSDGTSFLVDLPGGKPSKTMPLCIRYSPGLREERETLWTFLGDWLERKRKKHGWKLWQWLTHAEPRPFRLPEQGAELYRLAKESARRQGDYSMAGEYHFAEQCAKEYGNRKRSRWKVRQKRFWTSRLEWLFARMIFGYGEKVHRPLLAGLAVILIWAVLYFAMGGVAPGGPAEEAAAQNGIGFGECLYFSLITFTTLGYGDMVPNAHLFFRLLAGTQAWLGAALMALFVVALARKYTR